MMSVLGLALLTLTLSRCTEAFVPIGGGTSTHISITGTALLDTVRDTCRDVVEADGHEFEPTVRILPVLREPTSQHQQMYNRCDICMYFFFFFAFLCIITLQKGPSPEELVKACLGPSATGEVSGAKFHAALQEIYTQNGLVDRDFADRLLH